jgi:hypothetical protein
MLTFEEWVVGGNLVERCSSGSEPDPEPNREFVPVSNTTPESLQTICGGIVASKTSGHVILTKHCQVSFDFSIYHFEHRKLNTPIVLFSDLDTRYLVLILQYPCWGDWKPSLGNFGHIQGQVHVWLFPLYPTSLPCHWSRYVENLQEISCCFLEWDSGNTSTMYASVASSKVIQASFIHSYGFLSGYLSAKIPGLRTLWCTNSWSVGQMSWWTMEVCWYRQ